MAERDIEEGTARADGASVLAGLGFLTLTALVLAERFAEAPAALAAYVGAFYVLGRDSRR